MAASDQDDDVDLRYNKPLTRAALFVALTNLAYFGAEFTVAWLIGSVSLFADSIDSSRIPR